MTLKVNNYFKNLGKSVAYATADRYKAKHEFAYKTTTGTAKLAKDTIYNVVHYKNHILLIHSLHYYYLILLLKK